MPAVTRYVPVIGTSIGGVLVSPGEYSHTTPAVGGADTNSRSVVGGTVAAAGHCSVAGHMDAEVLADAFPAVELRGDDEGVGEDDEAGGSDGAD
jgi:hypothetical protein